MSIQGHQNLYKKKNECQKINQFARMLTAEGYYDTVEDDVDEEYRGLLNAMSYTFRGGGADSGVEGGKYTHSILDALLSLPI